ncbi:MAG: diaminopimelate decarboxylase [Alphaproteobacteria bacterium]
MFNYIKDNLYVEKISLEKIAKEIGTPFYCYSENAIKNSYKNFTSKLQNIDSITCFAVKSNPNLSIINILGKLGAGAECVSAWEIEKALKAGIKADKIIFSGVGKTKEEISYALEKNILQINIESESELKAINEIAKLKNLKAKIGIRINPNIDANTSKKITTGTEDSKFGIIIEQALQVAKFTKSLPNIELTGVSMHIGSQITKLYPYEKAIDKIVDFTECLLQENHKIKYLSLGGGIGVKYNDESCIDLNEYAKLCSSKTKNLGCKLIFEPGRLLVAEAGVIISKVLYIKKENNYNFIIIDAGMNDLLRPALYDSIHKIIPLKKRELIEKYSTSIVGPICESSDVFIKNMESQILYEEEDLLAITTVGAYGASMSSNYNSRPLISEVLVNEYQYKIIRKKQNFEDYIKLEL